MIYRFNLSTGNNVFFRLVHKEIGGQKADGMLAKLEEDVDFAYSEYEEAVRAEDRAVDYLDKVSLNQCINYAQIKIFFPKKLF